jgi:hypothetical protein
MTFFADATQKQVQVEVLGHRKVREHVIGEVWLQVWRQVCDQVEDLTL